MSQQDAAKEQATTRNNLRIVSIFTAAAIGIVGVLVILYAWQLPPFTRHSQFTDNAYVRGQTTFISPQAQPAVVKPGNPKFQEIIDYVEWLSDQQPHTFRVEGEEVVISA